MPLHASSTQGRVQFPQSNTCLRWLPFLVLLLAAVIVLLVWNHLPDRWPVHWGLHGKPDRWSRKAPLDVFFPIGFGIFLCGIIEGIATLLLAYPRAGKDQRVAPEAARTIAILTAEFTRAVSLALAIVFAGLALVLPLWQPARSGLLVLSILLILGMAITFGMWRMRQGARALQARGLFARLAGWNGLIYRNPQDPRIWVPKIAGFGYTLNFAHRRSWLLLLAILAVPMCVVFMVLWCHGLLCEG
jgi:uncharacterized membrane protein